MRYLLTTILFCSVVSLYAQVTPMKVVRVYDETTSIGIGLAYGDLLYDYSSEILYYVNNPIASTNAIEDVYGSVTQIMAITGNTNEIFYNYNGEVQSESVFFYTASENTLDVDKIDLDADKSKLELQDDPPDSGDYSGITFNLLGSMSAMQVAYISGNGTVSAADADQYSTMPAIGITIGTAEEVLTHGTMTNSAWSLTAGQEIYVSTTAGAITTTMPSGSGDIVQVIGYALDANTIFFTFDNTLIER